MSYKCKSLDLVHVGLCGADGIALAICAEKLERVRREGGTAENPDSAPSNASSVGGAPDNLPWPARPD